jgi:hypothetical protein
MQSGTRVESQSIDIETSKWVSYLDFNKGNYSSATPASIFLRTWLPRFYQDLERGPEAFAQHTFLHTSSKLDKSRMVVGELAPPVSFKVV